MQFCFVIKKNHFEEKLLLWSQFPFKIAALTCNEGFELPDGSYSVSDIQDSFEYIIKKHETFTDNPTKIYVNKTESKIVFNIKTGYYLELLTPETIKLLGSTKSKITKDKNGEKVTQLEITKVVLVNCNIVDYDYQQDLQVLCTSIVYICS